MANARHYSFRSFFRQVPNALLGRYFGARGLMAEVDFGSMKETKPEPLFEAWLDIPETQRVEMDAEFQEIFVLGCEKGFRAIIDEARFQMCTDQVALAQFIERLSTLPNHFHRAMVTFLDHAECWRGATYFYHADVLPYWRKRKNLGNRVAAVDDGSVKEFEDGIRDYFRLSEGRGNNCKVELFRRRELDYYFAYPEDFSQESVEWVNGEFDRRPHNPAFEVIFVYSQTEGTLDLNFRGARGAADALQGIFATTILKLDEVPPDPRDVRVYDLNPLRSRSFDFVFDVGSAIKDIVVRKLRLTSRVGTGERITLEAVDDQNPRAVYDLMAQVGQSVPLQLFNVTQVELSASVTTDETNPPKSVTIRLTHPNSCSLKYDVTDLELREMLHASGIEPKEPAPEVKGAEAAE